MTSEEKKQKARERAKAWYHANKERAKASNKRRYEKNKDLCLKQNAEWRKSNPDKRKAICKKYREANREALRSAGRKYYVKNKKQVCKANAEIRKRHKRLAADYISSLKNRPCMDCEGWYEPFQLHFDHRDPSTKLMAISSLVKYGKPMEVLRAEVEKCDLVCANCHALRTWKQIRSGVFYVQA